MRAFPLVLLLTLASVPGALATSELPIGVNDCDGGNICVIARTDPVCAGVGFGLQGTVACVNDGCLRVYVGFNRIESCPGTAISCGDPCPLPSVTREPGLTCVGVDVGSAAGAGACYDTRTYGEACVLTWFGGAYGRNCIPTD